MAGRRIIAVCGLRFEAAIAAGPDVAAVHALGIGRLGALAETMLSERGDYLGVISFGCAGGLDPRPGLEHCARGWRRRGWAFWPASSRRSQRLLKKRVCGAKPVRLPWTWNRMRLRRSRGCMGCHSWRCASS
jgi:hypothetical protein